MERLDNLLRHIRNVREGCELLGERLIKKGDEHTGVLLIANGNIHDNSKFYGIEWEYLNDGAWPKEKTTEVQDALFKAAHHHHVTNNFHHPEYWGSVEEMPDVYLAEMLCDWRARSSEQGTDLIEWLKDKATERFKFSTKGRVYKTLKDYAELLLERKFG